MYDKTHYNQKIKNKKNLKKIKKKKKEDKGFPGGSDGKESACNAEDLTLIPGLGRSPGGGHGNPLQYSCLENPMNRGAWRASFHGGRKELDTTEQLNK